VNPVPSVVKNLYRGLIARRMHLRGGCPILARSLRRGGFHRSVNRGLPKPKPATCAQREPVHAHQHRLPEQQPCQLTPM
jgi:hypothetical protein